MRRRTLGGFAAAAAVGALAILRPFGGQGCAIVGDCLALGLAQQAPECAANTRVGSSARTIAQRQRLTGRFRWCVISAGSNNPDDPNLRAQLRQIRAGMNCERVVWIVPAERRFPRAAAIVRAVAAERGDIPQTFAPGRDGVHPISYRPVMRAVRGRVQ